MASFIMPQPHDHIACSHATSALKKISEKLYSRQDQGAYYFYPQGYLCSRVNGHIDKEFASKVTRTHPFPTTAVEMLLESSQYTRSWYVHTNTSTLECSLVSAHAYLDAMTSFLIEHRSKLAVRNKYGYHITSSLSSPPSSSLLSSPSSSVSPLTVQCR